MDRVEDYVSTRVDVEKTMQSFQEMISYVQCNPTIDSGADSWIRKYQFMEMNQQKRAAGLKDKMPDIQKTLDTVSFLKTRKVIRPCYSWR